MLTLKNIDWRIVFVMLGLMGISLLVISSNDTFYLTNPDFVGLTPRLAAQLRWFAIGFLLFFFCAAFDYNRLRNFSSILYFVAILALIGLFFTEGHKSVQRWYRIFGIPIQPSELTKLILVIALSTYLEAKKQVADRWGTSLGALTIVGIPFLLILKQPDLGTALILFPMSLAIFYFGNVRPSLIRVLSWAGLSLLLIVFAFFSGLVPHDKARPYVTSVLKEYQYDRLKPDTHHQKAAKVAIGVGGISGTGWKKSTYTRRGWLPEPQTDSVFPAFCEEFGLFGAGLLLALYWALLVLSFRVTAVAKDPFGRLLAAGITAYLAMHVLINIGMMSGLLPITGIPLILISYGGASVMATMAALGILQSIYSRRYMFSR